MMTSNTENEYWPQQSYSATFISEQLAKFGRSTSICLQNSEHIFRLHLFLASKDALEVMRVTEKLTE